MVIPIGESGTKIKRGRTGTIIWGETREMVIRGVWLNNIYEDGLNINIFLQNYCRQRTNFYVSHCKGISNFESRNSPGRSGFTGLRLKGMVGKEGGEDEIVMI